MRLLAAAFGVIGIGWLAPEPLALKAADTSQTPSGVARVPHFEVDPMFFQNLPNRWTTGMVGGIDVDAQDHVWVLHRPASIADGEKAAALNPPQALCCIPAPPVLEFDANGRLVNSWGGPGEGFEWPTTEHGITVDHKQNIWIAGNGKGDNHALKFTKSGKLLLQIGRRNQSQGSNDTANLGRPAGIFVYPKTNEVFVADGYGNRRVIVFDADTGAYKRHWGAYGKTPDDGCEVFVNRTTLQNEGTVHNFALSRDPVQRYLFVADGSNKAIHILDRRTLTLLDSIGGHGGHNAREFFHLHSLASQPDSKGNLYVGEVNQGQRYYRLRFTGTGQPVNAGYSTVSAQ